jgi:hypothetical protein
MKMIKEIVLNDGTKIQKGMEDKEGGTVIGIIKLTSEYIEVLSENYGEGYSYYFDMEGEEVDMDDLIDLDII